MSPGVAPAIRWGRLLVAALLLALIAAMPGCGSSKKSKRSNDAGSDPNTVGAVTLPAGIDDALTSFSIANVSSEAQLDSEGAFEIEAEVGGPSFVVLLDEQGRPTLYGFVDPDDDEAGAIDALSTATVLLFSALEAWFLQDVQAVTILEFIRDAPETQDLADLLAVALAGDRELFAGDTLPITDEVAGAVESMRARAPVLARQARFGAATGGIQEANILAEPQAAQSGVIVGPNTAGAGLQVTNQRRRNTWYFVYKVGSEDFNGVRTDVDPPVLVQEGFLGGTNGITGTVQTIQDYFLGSLTFEDQFLTPAIELPIEDDEDAVFFEVAVAGGYLPVIKPHPDFFDASIPRHLEWQRRGRQMLGVSFLKDVLMPMIFSLGGPIGSLDTLNNIGPEGFQRFADASAAIGVLLPGVTPKISNGEFLSAAIDVLRALPNSPELRAELTNLIVFLSDFIDVPISQEAVTFLGRANAAVVIIDIGLAGMDLYWVGDDLTVSDTMNRWDVEATPLTVRLTAEREVLTPEAPDSTITARVPGNAPNEPFCWRWVLNGPGDLSDFSGNTASGDGAVLDTDEREIQYLVDPLQIEPGLLAEIEVEAFRPEPGCSSPPQGASVATGVISFDGEPADVVVELNPRDVLLRIQSTVALNAQAMGAGQGANIEFDFSTSGSFGVLEGTSETGTSFTQPSGLVTFVAGDTPGTAIVTVEAFQIFPSERALLGSANATIRIRDGELDCEDGLDGDRDTYTDCADRDCANDDACFIDAQFTILSTTYDSGFGMVYVVDYGFVFRHPEGTQNLAFQQLCANVTSTQGLELDYSFLTAFDDSCETFPELCRGLAADEYVFSIRTANQRVDACNIPGNQTDHCNEAEANAFFAETYGPMTATDVILAGSGRSCSAQRDVE